MVALFVANGMFVRAFFAPQLQGIDNRIYQPIQFGMPIIMLFLEYWFFDRLRWYLRKR